jgi:hypothetical protein
MTVCRLRWRLLNPPTSDILQIFLDTMQAAVSGGGRIWLGWLFLAAAWMTKERCGSMQEFAGVGWHSMCLAGHNCTLLGVGAHGPAHILCRPCVHDKGLLQTMSCLMHHVVTMLGFHCNERQFARTSVWGCRAQ